MSENLYSIILFSIEVLCSMYYALSLQESCALPQKCQYWWTGLWCSSEQCLSCPPSLCSTCGPSSSRTPPSWQYPLVASLAWPWWWRSHHWRCWRAGCCQGCQDCPLWWQTVQDGQPELERWQWTLMSQIQNSYRTHLWQYSWHWPRAATLHRPPKGWPGRRGGTHLGHGKIFSIIRFSLKIQTWMIHSIRYSCAMASLQLTTCSRMPGNTSLLYMSTWTISNWLSLTRLVPTKILNSKWFTQTTMLCKRIQNIISCHNNLN